MTADGWALLVPSAWAAVVVAAAMRWRPAPGRVRALPVRGGSAGADGRGTTVAGTDVTGGVGPGGAGLRSAAGDLLERLGGWLLRVARRPPVPATARRLGTAVVAAAVLVPVFPLASPVAALVAWGLPGIWAGAVERRRLAALAADLPDVVDLLTLAVGAGLTVGLAVAHVARRGSGPLTAELRQVIEDVTLGRRLADALDDLPTRAGEAVRPLVGALVASERYGAPLVTSLERLADEVRRDRRRRAEEAARKVPVKLLFPLVACTLPAFGLLTVAPLIASAVRSLRV
ncbi:MAG TPA: type II secretion system F family protein [Acidimicrobiales bacterium]|nr:type II secretion system F family protein [Acidimicrobiales bacterium]